MDDDMMDLLLYNLQESAVFGDWSFNVDSKVFQNRPYVTRKQGVIVSALFDFPIALFCFVAITPVRRSERACGSDKGVRVLVARSHFLLIAWDRVAFPPPGESQDKVNACAAPSLELWPGGCGCGGFPFPMHEGHVCSAPATEKEKKEASHKKQSNTGRKEERKSISTIGKTRKTLQEEA